MKYHIEEEERIELSTGTDNVLAVSAARHLAKGAAFDETTQYLIATAVSELATNAIRYGGGGEVRLRIIRHNSETGFEVEVLDSGPGIQDIDAVMQENYSTGDSLGQGLPGVQRIMDEFFIDTSREKGTRCVARKWI